VVVYTWRGESIRIISARPAEGHEREEYEAQPREITTTSAKGSEVEYVRRNLSPRARLESRFGSIKILWIASFEWRKNPEARPAIKP
jgi:hypothetical protein